MNAEQRFETEWIDHLGRAVWKRSGFR